MRIPSELAGIIALLVLAAAGIGLCVRRMHENKLVKANDTIVIGRPPELAAAAVISQLLSIRGTRMEGITPYRSVLVMTRTPSWAILPALWLFPFGVFFLMMRCEVRLHVSLYASQSGTVVKLTGNTEMLMLRKARTTIHALPGARVGADRTPSFSLYS